ncbi:hypothetical protein F5Y18DRAFT_221305 [Xylariaceae sp. FL1019]|nr:hypothetical protein F5Y18DRAFT_221305 [Xylariaceae sp. FL1019]
MNTVKVMGMLVAGVVAQSSITTIPSMSMSMSSSLSSAASSVTTIDPASLINSTAPTYTYFNVTITSTVVVNELTTLCPEATTLTFNDCEYTATAGEQIVVTNCPCTVTTALPTLTSSICTEPTLPMVPVAPSAPPAPVPTTETEVAAAAPTAPAETVETEAPAEPTEPAATLPPVVQVGGAASNFGQVQGLALAVAAVALGL